MRKTDLDRWGSLIQPKPTKPNVSHRNIRCESNLLFSRIHMCMQRKGNILYFICRSSITTTLLCVPALNNENTLQLQCRWCQQQRGGLSLPCETVRLIRTCRWNLLRHLQAKTMRGGSVKIFALQYKSNKRTQRTQTTKRWTEENIATWFPGPNVVHDSLTTTKGF